MKLSLPLGVMHLAKPELVRLSRVSGVDKVINCVRWVLMFVLYAALPLADCARD